MLPVMKIIGHRYSFCPKKTFTNLAEYYTKEIRHNFMHVFPSIYVIKRTMTSLWVISMYITIDK